MKYDYPDQSGQWLPPNLKAGDKAAMIMLSVIWWDKNGKAFKDLEYGRVPWTGFSLDPFLTGSGVSEKASDVGGFEKSMLRMAAEHSDDDRSFVKEMLPGARANPEAKKRSIFSRAGRWIVDLFRF